jgi:histidinol-phosphate phosphatase family protein
VSARRALFFDRDGTLNREVEGALASPAQLELLPRAAEAVARANGAGWLAIVLTNQSAIARGWMTPFELERVHAALRARLAEHGARLDDVLYCPHFDEGGLAPYARPCECRKPQPGLLRLAAERWDLDLGASWVVGDAVRDLAAARAVGARAILVRTGKGAREAARLSEPGSAVPCHAVAADVGEAVLLALEASQGK